MRNALVRLAAAAVAVEVCAAKLEFEGEGGEALDEPPARVVCKEREATASELPENECVGEFWVVRRKGWLVWDCLGSV